MITDASGVFFDTCTDIPSWIEYVVVPHGEDVSKLVDPKNLNPPLFVSMDWVRECVKQKTLVDPQSDVFYQPIPFKPPHPTLQSVVATSTNLLDEERVKIATLLSYIGATFTAGLTKKNTHLFCTVAKGEKYKRALQWKTAKIVSPKWLYESVRQGKWLEEAKFVEEVKSEGSEEQQPGADYEELEENKDADSQKQFVPSSQFQSNFPPFAGVTAFINAKVNAAKRTLLVL